MTVFTQFPIKARYSPILQDLYKDTCSDLSFLNCITFLDAFLLLKIMDTEFLKFVINSLTEVYRGQLNYMQDFNAYIQHKNRMLRNKLETNELYYNNLNTYTAPAVINTQPTTINTQPTTINNQPTDVNIKSTILNIQPTVSDIQSTITDIAATSHTNVGVDYDYTYANKETDGHCFKEAFNNLNNLSNSVASHHSKDIKPTTSIPSFSAMPSATPPIVPTTRSEITSSSYKGKGKGKRSLMYIYGCIYYCYKYMCIHSTHFL